ncbi:MAG: hypothetical protein KKC75_05475 [Nanoarchaeota archaeon]|nr:hypothetical protein [Nanoarchaeota archaeon]MBU1005003.1 hypothetical protein [Nanoarchaeota archaeon]MBU1945895.1 hypothetical protein [Nanoarchaeota archaeon]
MKKKIPEKAPKYTLKKEDIHKLINYATKVPSKAAEFKKEVRKNITTAILAAFAFVIALVWRDAIQAGVNELVNRLGITGTGYAYQITTALIVTLVCIIGILVFSRLKGEENIKK